MRHLAESAAYGIGSVTLVTVAGVQDFLVKLASSLVIATLSAVIAHYVRRALVRRDFTKKAQDYKRRHPERYDQPRK